MFQKEAKPPYEIIMYDQEQMVERETKQEGGRSTLSYSHTLSPSGKRRGKERGKRKERGSTCIVSLPSTSATKGEERQFNFHVLV